MTPRQLAIVQEGADAMEALHRGDIGTQAEWQARWQRHAKAAMEMRTLIDAQRTRRNRKEI